MPPPAEVPSNAGPLRHLGGGLPPDQVPIGPVTEATDTWRLGANPDLVDWLWNDLASVLPGDARCLVAGGAAIVHPASGLLVAAALGTQYALRLSGRSLDDAIRAGYETRHEFRTVGRTIDLATEFGPGWVFGRFAAGERRWLADSTADAAAASESGANL
ncbi:MAG: hypothetical protein IT341_08065 [Chloroflexi bacterium]|nr:hypothetical protein [Chloroflexota bacterium]